MLTDFYRGPDGDTAKGLEKLVTELGEFNFRGIDSVVNAVGPALRKHGVTIIPEDVEAQRTKRTTASGKVTSEVVIKVTYRIYGPAGDSIQGRVAAEATDYGDKATPKAMSVAYRTFLLQALTVPTDEPDPDEHTYERGVSQEKRGVPGKQGSPNQEGAPVLDPAQCGTILEAFCHEHQLDGDKVRQKYFNAGGNADPNMLKAWLTAHYNLGMPQERKNQ